MELPHGGVSKARNAGIDAAKGSKIFFWDSDDSVELTTIEKCIEFSEKLSVNSVLYGYANQKNGIKGKPHSHNLYSEYRGVEIIKYLMPHFLGHSYADINKWIKGVQSIRYGKENTALWRIMLDTNTIKEYGIKFNPNLSLGEDTVFINEYFLYETSIGFLDECLYYLTIREDGANLSSLNNAFKRLQDKLKLIEERVRIDKTAYVKYKINTHAYWTGTLVLSVVELAIRLSINKSLNLNLHQRYSLFRQFIENTIVKSAVDKFRPVLGVKGIPFVIMKLLGCKAVFVILLLLPNKIKRVIFNSI